MSLTGRLVVRAVRTGRDTQLSQLIRLVERAQAEKAAIQRVADRVCAVFVPAVLGCAVLTLAGWLLAGSPAGRAVSAGLAVAAAISAAARTETGPLPEASDFRALPGLGARGTLDGRAVVVGRETLFAGYGMTAPASLAARCRAWEEAGCTAVLAGWDGEVRGAIAVADTIKPSAAGAVARLRGLGLHPMLLTGDAVLGLRRLEQPPAAAVPRELSRDRHQRDPVARRRDRRGP